MSKPDIVIDGLRVVAGGRTILSVDELTINRGEMVAVLGRMGLVRAHC